MHRIRRRIFALLVTWYSRRGQALVEAALILPVFMLAALGAIEAGFLFAGQHGYQSEADVLTDWAAAHEADAPGGAGFSEGVPGAPWQSLVADESARTGCDGSPSLAWPDGREPGDRVVLTLSCHYTPRITSNIWPGGLDVGVNAAAVIPGAVPSPSPEASPSEGTS